MMVLFSIFFCNTYFPSCKHKTFAQPVSPITSTCSLFISSHIWTMYGTVQTSIVVDCSCLSNKVRKLDFFDVQKDVVSTKNK